MGTIKLKTTTMNTEIKNMSDEQFAEFLAFHVSQVQHFSVVGKESLEYNRQADFDDQLKTIADAIAIRLAQ